MPHYEGYGDSIIHPHPFESGVKGEPDRCRRCLGKRDHPAHFKSNIRKSGKHVIR